MPCIPSGKTALFEQVGPGNIFFGVRTTSISLITTTVGVEAVCEGFRGWLVPIAASLNGSYRHRSSSRYFGATIHNPCRADGKRTSKQKCARRPNDAEGLLESLLGARRARDQFLDREIPTCREGVEDAESLLLSISNAPLSIVSQCQYILDRPRYGRCAEIVPSFLPAPLVRLPGLAVLPNALLPA
jgi:hypothetical protein